eukprot:UN01127
MACHNNLILIGGKDIPTEVWNWKDEKLIWSADHNEPDYLGIREPMWVRDGIFFNNATIGCVTGSGKILKYDIEKSAKPVSIVDGKRDGAMQRIVPDNQNPNCCYVGANSGPIIHR